MEIMEKARITEHVLFVALEYAEREANLKHYEAKWRTTWVTMHRLLHSCNVEPILWKEAYRNPVDAYTFLDIMEMHMTGSRTLIKEIYEYYTSKYLR